MAFGPNGTFSTHISMGSGWGLGVWLTYQEKKKKKIVIDNVGTDGTPFSSAHAYKAEGGRRFLRCGTHVKKWRGSTRVSHSTPKKAPTIKGAPFIVGYFFVVPGKLFCLYSLGNFCNPTSKVTPPTCCLLQTLMFLFDRVENIGMRWIDKK